MHKYKKSDDHSVTERSNKGAAGGMKSLEEKLKVRGTEEGRLVAIWGKGRPGGGANNWKIPGACLECSRNSKGELQGWAE